MGNDAKKGADLNYDLEMTLEEAAKNSVFQLKLPRSVICLKCEGTGAKSSYNQVINARCAACLGIGYIEKIDNFKVQIPAGVDTGSRVRIPGKGDERLDGTGDLFILTTIAKHKVFERLSDDLYCKALASSEQLLRGLKIDIPTLVDGITKLKLPAMTETGTVFRVQGKGMPNLKTNSTGDLYVTVTWSASASVQSVIKTPDKPQARLKVFLCHSSTDKEAVRDLYHRLKTEGITPWFDEEDLLPGQRWQTEIPKAVKDSDIVIVCLTQNSINKKGYLQREIRYALDAAQEQPDEVIYLIPLKLEECEIPEHLRAWQWVNFFEERGYERLMRALRQREKCL